jgi:hypothetical protein
MGLSKDQLRKMTLEEIIKLNKDSSSSTHEIASLSSSAKPGEASPEAKPKPHHEPSSMDKYFLTPRTNNEIVIYYITRGLKILDYTRRVARKHHEIVDRVVFPATRRVIENFPSSSCIRVDYIMN